jgi:hypothetical protein
MRMAREWRHLKMVIRAGRSHDPAGVTATRKGECTVLCPACPHPGMNMEEGWEQVPDDRKSLHALFLALDANFRLKRKNVSSQKADPGLNKGWAYFVEETAYKTHLNGYKNQRDPVCTSCLSCQQIETDKSQKKSTCSRHDAVNLSNSKPNRGHAASGVGKVVCARHGMNLPSSVGDLQVGERFVDITTNNSTRLPMDSLAIAIWITSFTRPSAIRS